MIPFLEPQRDLGPTTFAEPGENVSFGERLAGLRKFLPENIAADIGANPKAFSDLVGSAFQQNMLVETEVSRNISTEQAYDRRIAAVKAATGVELENPLRGGYGDQVKRAARDALRDRLMQEGDEPPESLVTGGRVFDEKLAELRDKHPDKLDALTFGDVRKEAEAIAKGADDEYEAAKKTTPLTPGAALVAEFVGGFGGHYRSPLFVGSMFLGPTTAVGKTVAARIATSSLFQGFYNAGISALEQPAVQQWRSDIGVKSGVMPAIENVGMAFLFGVIPGAAFRTVHELGAAERLAVRRVMDGAPEPGDLEKVAARFGEADPVQAQAIRLGEEMDDAAKITAPRPAKDVSPELHDDLTTAAQRYADDPINQPSPEGVAAVREPEKLPPEVQERIAAARPETLHDAQIAASEALEDIGNRDTIARTRAELDNTRVQVTESAARGRRTGDFVDFEIPGVGKLTTKIEDGALTVAEGSSFVEKEFRGQGNGIAMYERAIAWAQERGLTFRSDFTVSDDATQIYRALKRRGYTVTEQTETRAQPRFEVTGPKLPPASSKDPLDKLPMARDDGTPTMVSHQQVARAGERETKFADLIRECK